MKKLVIGIDIGGINTVLGLVDRTGEVYARSSFRTAEYPFFDDYPAYVEMLVRTLRELCAAMPAGAVLSGIGIGAPNANYHTGRIERPVNLWKFRSGEPNPEEGRRFFSLCKEVGNSFPGIPVRITNDANAAALGEIAYGNAGGMRDFIMVTLGTGVGGGIMGVVPGVMGVAAFAPPLDDAGNSVKAQAALSDIVGRLNLNIFHPRKSILAEQA